MLRPLAEDDVPAIVAACQDPEIPRWTLVPSPYTEDDARAWIADAGRQWREGTGAHFAVADVRTGRLVGSIGLRCSDWPVVEAGYWVSREARGLGVGTGALRLVSGWALRRLGAARVQLVADVDNAASQRVAEKAGFVREGVLRQALETKGRRSDCVMFSLLPGDLT